MPSPGAPAAPRLPMEDAYLELLADTLEVMDIPARSQFLQRYFRTTTHLDMRESQCLHLWEEMLTRRRELTDQLGRPISLKTVLMDVLSSAGLIRVPIVLEYEEYKKLQVNAITDPLTGLYNRRLFAESFEKELNRARRYGLPLGIVILDLHRFKEVNDKYGHPRGDDVLRAAATTLQKALRTSDSAFRIGGDEFALLLPQTDSAQASALSRRIGIAFAETLRPLELSISVTMDHGVSTYPQDGEQRDSLIRIADERLYQSKNATHKKSDSQPAPSVEPVQNASSSSATIPTLPVVLPPAPSAPEPEPPPTPEATAPAAFSTTPLLQVPPISPLQSSPPSFQLAPDETRLYTVPRK